MCILLESEDFVLFGPQYACRQPACLRGSSKAFSCKVELQLKQQCKEGRKALTRKWNPFGSYSWTRRNNQAFVLYFIFDQSFSVFFLSLRLRLFSLRVQGKSTVKPDLSYIMRTHTVGGQAAIGQPDKKHIF